MGIKVKDYIDTIELLKQKAINDGKKSIIIHAKKLHGSFPNQKTPTLIQCCSAMRQCMLEGDKVVQDKNNKCGASSSLKIMYDLNNLEKRRKSNPFAGKRGRPKKINQKEILEDNINEIFEKWMIKQKYVYKDCGNHYLIDDYYGIWLIQKYKANIQETFITMLTLFQDIHRCSMILPDEKESYYFYNKLPEDLIDRLYMGVFIVKNENQVIKL